MLYRRRRRRVVALSSRHCRVSDDIAGRLQGGEGQKQQQRRERGGYTSALSSITVTHLADVEHPCRTRRRAALPCRGDSLVSGDARVGGRGGVVEARSRGSVRRNEVWCRCVTCLWEHEVEAVRVVFRRGKGSAGLRSIGCHFIGLGVNKCRFTVLAVTAAPALMPP